MEERTLTKHQRGKAGVNISKRRYEAIRKAIMLSLHAHGEMTYTALAKAVEQRLRGFDGSVRRYTETVKLDLEARRVIERVQNTRPQRLRLISRQSCVVP
jgi:hypothetical protein